ncbi:MAG: PKD domain-containing protein [Bacteroidia bacterium]|nr:PKD domain-containing protein [Bacteroidia bacterium]
MSTFLNQLSLKFFIVILTLHFSALSQNLNWPLDPVTSQHRIVGTTGEYRQFQRFHQGVDIHDAGLQQVKAILSGIVTSVHDAGSNSFVKITSNGGITITYIHIQRLPGIELNSLVTTGQEIGTMYNWSSPHVHLESEQFNFLDQHLTPFQNYTNTLPVVSGPTPPAYANKFFFKDGLRHSNTTSAFPLIPGSNQQYIFGKADIVANIEHCHILANGGYEQGSCAPYIINWEISDAEGHSSGEIENYRFSYVPDDADADECFLYGSTMDNPNYILTARPNHASSSYPDLPVERYFNSKEKLGFIENTWNTNSAISDASTSAQTKYPDGLYNLLIQAKVADQDGILEDQIGSRNVSFRIDNYRPYISNVQVKEISQTGNEETLLYDGTWEYTNSTLHLDPFQLGNNQTAGMNNVRLKEMYHNGKDIEIVVHFSEAIPNIPGNPRVRLRCGATYSTLTSANSTYYASSDLKYYTYHVPSSTLSALFQSPDENVFIEVEAKDYTGADLLGFNPNQTATNYISGNNEFSYLQIPYRNWNGGQVEWSQNQLFSSSTIDKSHLFKRVNPCSGGTPTLGGSSACPLADFSASVVSITAGESVTFHNLSENLNNGYTWDFGDGNTGTTITVNQSISHTYNVAGTFTVRLNGVGVGVNGQETYIRQRLNYIEVLEPESVSNPGGNGGTNGVLYCDFNFYPSNPLVLENVDFEFLGSGGVPPYQYFWSFQDGNPANSSSENPSTAFISSGSVKTITLIITDFTGQTASHTEYIPVGSNEPVLAFTNGPGQSCMTLVPGSTNQFSTGQMVSFVPAPINNSQGLVIYHWDFGDGSFSQEFSPAHVYSNPGNYLASLTITAFNGQTLSCNQALSVTNPYQISNLTVQSTNGTSRQLVGNTAEAFNLQASFDGAGVSQPNIYYWNFHFIGFQSTIQQADISVQTTSPTLSQYPGMMPPNLVPGNWFVTVTACNSQGCISSEALHLIVNMDQQITESSPLEFGNLNFQEQCYSTESDANHRIGLDLTIGVLESSYPNALNHQCMCQDPSIPISLAPYGPYITFAPLQANADYYFDNTIGPNSLNNWMEYANCNCTSGRGFACVVLDNFSTTVFPKHIEGKISAAACEVGTMVGDPATLVTRTFEFDMYKCLKASDISMPASVDLCPGTTYQLNAINNNKARPPFTYQWTSTDPGAMDYISDPTILNPQFTFPSGLDADITYKLQIHSGEMTWNFNQYDPYKLITFHLHPIAVELPVTTYHVCLGNTIDLHASSTGGDGMNNQYIWMRNINISPTTLPNFVPSPNLTNANTADPTFEGPSNGSYDLYVFVNSLHGQCMGYGMVTIIVDDQVEPVSAGEDIISCSGKELHLDGEMLSTASSAMFQYRWYKSGVEEGDFQLCNLIQPTGISMFSPTSVAPYQTTEYTLEVLQPNGCSSTDELVIFIDETLNPIVTYPEDQFLCHGVGDLELSLQVQGGIAPYWIDWWKELGSTGYIQLANDQPSILLGYNTIFQSISPQDHVVNIVTDVVDANGCHTKNFDHPIRVEANSQIKVIPSGDQQYVFYRDGNPLPPFENILQIEGGVPDYSYTWTKNGDVVSTAFSFQPDVVHAGEYILDVFDSKGCHQSTSNSVEINFFDKNPNPVLDLPIEVCEGHRFSIFLKPYLEDPFNPYLSGWGLAIFVNHPDFVPPMDIIGIPIIPATGGEIEFFPEQAGDYNLHFQFGFRDLDWIPPQPIYVGPNSIYDFTIPVHVVPAVGVVEPNVSQCSDINTQNELENTYWAQQILACPSGPVSVEPWAVGRYYAGQSIKLLPGFKSNFQSDFIAKIQCVETIVERLDETNPSSNQPAVDTLVNHRFDSFNYFPNPSTGKLNFELNLSTDQRYFIDLLDLTGRNVKKITAGIGSSGKGTVDLSDLSPGTYYIKLTCDLSSLDQRTYKLIKLN